MNTATNNPPARLDADGCFELMTAIIGQVIRDLRLTDRVKLPCGTKVKACDDARQWLDGPAFEWYCEARGMDRAHWLGLIATLDTTPHERAGGVRK